MQEIIQAAIAVEHDVIALDLEPRANGANVCEPTNSRKRLHCRCMTRDTTEHAWPPHRSYWKPHGALKSGVEQTLDLEHFEKQFVT
jgi:hypothetical protein